jgi:hypothetical protein
MFNAIPLILEKAMKRLLLTTTTLMFATSAIAEADYSARIGEDGLSATIDALADIADPTASDRFALGGTRFLRSIERALQTRYRFGVSSALTEMADIPVLRLPIAENPNPQPFDPEVIEQMFADIAYDMDIALTELEAIGDADQVAVTIDTADLWFDINMNDTRDAGEGVLDVTGMSLNRSLNGVAPPVIRFDTADAAWLAAYAHLLSGISDVVLAFHPAPAITRVLADAQTIAAMPDPAPGPYEYDFDTEMGRYADLAAIFIGALEQQPDPVLTRAAHAHFLGMIAQNRVFWSRVVTERDNEAEWIPNKAQTSALPLDFPPETGDRWRAVLSDAEQVLNGSRLIPHWRMGDTHGINLAELMQNPPPVDLVGFIQGGALLPFVQQGVLIDRTSLDRFADMLQGDAGLYMVILN